MFKTFYGQRCGCNWSEVFWDQRSRELWNRNSYWHFPDIWYRMTVKRKSNKKKLKNIFQILPQTLSGSELFGGLQPPKTCNTFDSVIKSKGGVGEDGNSTGQSFLLPLSKQQKRVFSWLAISRPSLTCRLREAFPLPWCGTFIMGLILCRASLELLDVSQHPLTFDCTFNLSLEVTSGYVIIVFKSLFLHLYNLYKFWMGPLNSHRNVYNQSPVWYSH